MQWQPNHDTKTWHDDVLGDLVLDDSWYWPTRPINVLPHTRAEIHTQFIIHTRDNPGETGDTFLTADKASIDASTFDPSKPIKFITHGFIDTGYTNWVMTFVRALLRHGDYNVIRVNWGAGSLPMYFTASANTRVVGLEIGYLVNFLIDNYGVDPANVHLLGHSLGSHVSGYAGEKIKGLGHITGLDPAGPYYTDTADYIRIDNNDATYVDCIHTDAKTILLLGYGSEEAMGNLDFFPNAGYNQPGCDPVDIAIELITDIGEGVRELGACSHQRSIELFIDSIDQSCSYVGHECIDYESFERGRCASCAEDNSKCALMGIHADEYTHKDRVNVKMYFDTDKKTPYCYYHYQIVIDTAHPKGAADQVKGHLNIWLYGDNGEVIEDYRLTKKHEIFEHGQTKYFLMASHTDLSRVMRMEVKWVHTSLDLVVGPPPGSNDPSSPNLFNNDLYIRSIHVSSMEYYPETNRLDHTKNLCDVGKDYIEIKSGHTEQLISDDSCSFNP